MSHQPQHPQASARERNKYQSPPPPPSSITPPPSSKAPTLAYVVARTPTPTQSHLSSPPPTVKTPPPHQPLLEPGTPTPLSDELADPSIEDLRLKLAAATAECRSAKASAAHHRLQYELLTMEFSEALKRFDVEFGMAQKEVEVLQLAQSRPQNRIESPKFNADGASSVPSVSDLTILDLKNTMRLLEHENDTLRRRVSDAKALVLEREAMLSEENESLRRRIRENREHVNYLRQAGGIFNLDQSPPSAYHTPYTASMRHTHNPQFTAPSEARGVEPFAALLLADQVLSQEAASTPSTPITKPMKRHQAAHIRGSQSVSSLPSTPYRSAPIVSSQTNNARYHPQPYLASSPLQSTPPSSRHVHRRRQSRDSTISASEIDDQEQSKQNEDRVLDSDDEGRVISPSFADDHPQEVYASQASQEAANMLRKSSSFSKQQQSPARRKPGKTSRSGISSSSTLPKGGKAADSGLIQSKMYGYQITKPGVSGQPEGIKRRFYDDTNSPPKQSKKARMNSGTGDAETIGLGIGGLAGSAR